ncbi:hypothetical protein [Solemya velesiana gill symbiont]|uniref:hypothetical protein n=1 Tax=Solemya velesiana gill symbiont TaxID=1918948 RepID=UPI001560D8AE|nr:hypothetical protein [Solemya velesiana gill symbiont]
MSVQYKLNQWWVLAIFLPGGVVEGIRRISAFVSNIGRKEPKPAHTLPLPPEE